VLFKKKVSRSVGGNLALLIVLLLFGAFMLLPLLFTIMSAFKPLDEIFIFPPQFFVRRPTLVNFITLSQIVDNFWVPISRYTFNSFFVTIAGTAGQIIICSLAAYPMARHSYVGKRFVDGMIILSLLFTSAVTALPMYVTLSWLGMINTYWAVILPAWQISLGLYLMKQFMTMLPEEMLEAARIDGASEWRIYARIVMPNIKPAWLTVIVFSFREIWNSAVNTGIGTNIIYQENLRMLPSLYNQILAGGEARMGAVYAFALMLLIPPIVMFIIAQSSIMETMSTSGMK
jgi:ABC-type glycerol-3-phosphate transport system permease component